VVNFQLTNLPTYQLTIISLISLLGSYCYLKVSLKRKEKYSTIQRFVLISCAPILVLFSMSVHFHFPLYALALPVWIGFMIPIWNTNNTLILRNNIPSNQYGEVFGFIRIPRALLTFLGMSIIGWCQDKNLVGQAAAVSGCLLLLTALYLSYLDSDTKD
jgi:hypothetical protein